MKQAWKPYQWLAGVIVLAHLCTADASAQTYPAKPIRILLGFAPGGAIDFTARLVAKKLSDTLGQPVVVENRAGAGGAIATEAVVKSPPDGYTLLILSSASTALPALRKLPFDTERDLAPVSMVSSGASLLVVHPSVPARNARELIALARSRPGKLTYGSSGVGTATHFMGILFTLMTKVDILHIPFKGSAETTSATASGEIDMAFFNVTSALPLYEARKIRPLATTATKRISAMSAIPTLDESGLPGYEYSLWYGLFAPAAVPRDIIARLNTLIDREINTAEMKAILNKQGLEARTSTPEEFASIVRRDLALNAKLVKLSGAKGD